MCGPQSRTQENIVTCPCYPLQPNPCVTQTLIILLYKGCNLLSPILGLNHQIDSSRKAFLTLSHVVRDSSSKPLYQSLASPTKPLYQCKPVLGCIPLKFLKVLKRTLILETIKCFYFQHCYVVLVNLVVSIGCGLQNSSSRFITFGCPKLTKERWIGHLFFLYSFYLFLFNLIQI